MLWLLVLLMSLMSGTLNRLVLLAVGALHPAYASCKAVRSRNPREYVRWMMYWVVLAGLLTAEPLVDLMFSCCVPLYTVFKLALLVWLQSSSTKGSSIVFRKLVLPQFVRREREIDDKLSDLRVRASKLGTSTARYMTHVVMSTAFTHVQENSSVSDLMRSDLKFSADTLTSVDDMSELATGDQGKRRRTRGHGHAEDDANKNAAEISNSQA